ncbi:MAG: ferredoxin III, nif-specific [Coriobacteriia bacterium]|nr:ferredoxin III, nif-specific [Coriobacteriia bacterium]
MATGLTRDGREWVPEFLDSIDSKACIGCGRCYKVCGRGVMAPLEVEFDDDEDDEDIICTVMAVCDAGACIGCQSCSKVCAKNAHQYAAA